MNERTGVSIDYSRDWFNLSYLFNPSCVEKEKPNIKESIRDESTWIAKYDGTLLKPLLAFHRM